MKNPNFIIIKSISKKVEDEKTVKKTFDIMPFLSEFVKEGVYFKRAYKPTPSTIPSQISMFTGRYSHCHGITTNNHFDNGDNGMYYVSDLMDLFKLKGYKTCLCGKNNCHRLDFDVNYQDSIDSINSEDSIVGKSIRWLDSLENKSPFFVMIDNESITQQVCLDVEIRKLYEYLNEHEQINNTYIILVVENAIYTVYNEDNINMLSENICRVDLVWTGPLVKVKEKEEVACVNLIDIYPTICEILGEEIPYGVQGKSLLPILKGEKYPEKEFDVGYSECSFGDINTRMVRKGDFKLIANTSGDIFLYDISKDFLEENNLVNKNEYETILSDMLSELAIAMMKAVDPLPKPQRRYRVKLDKRNYWNSFIKYDTDPKVGGFPAVAFKYAKGEVKITEDKG